MSPRFRPYALSAAVLVLDRLTKWWIETHLTFYDIYQVIPGFFQIVHTQNRGIAFGIFNDGATDSSSLALIVFSLLILGFISAMLWHYSHTVEREHWTLRYGLGMVLGGALGNVFDRVFHGAVTDFLDFYWGHWHFPSFNVADSAITVGAGLLLLNLWKPGEKKRNAGAAEGVG